jgi:hypothetical protein
MTFGDQIREHQSQCHPHLCRLRWLARDEDELTVPRQVAAGVREATSAVIAQADVTIRAAQAATPDRSREPAMEAFMRVRLTRLADAADEAVQAACACDTPRLRSVLRRFEALTSAIWTVQEDLYGTLPLPRVAEDDGCDPAPRATSPYVTPALCRGAGSGQ